MPMICPPVCCVAAALAAGEWYPISSAVARILARISSLTPSLPASALDTDTMLMPNFSAISAMRTPFAIRKHSLPILVYTLL